jgi:hypothetical protein
VGVTEPRSDSDVSLPQFLSARARRASDARLALDVACGFVVAIVAVLWRGPAWHVIASAAICFLAYGSWGIADREMHDRSATRPDKLAALRAGRIVAVTVGSISGVALILSGLFFMLGRIQS